MGTGAKIAIGCTLAAFVVGAAVVVSLFGLAWWGKSKLDKVAGTERTIQDLQKRADAAPFHEPADGLIAEDRLLKFLEVRKRTFGVYEKHRSEIAELAEKRDGGLTDLSRSFGIIQEVRAAQAAGLSAVGMSTAEYQYLVGAIYRSGWASEFAKETQGKQPSRSASEALGQLSGQLEAMGPEGARAAEQVKAAQEQAERGLQVPEANIQLFRKHEAEIKKYAMTGLEWLGL